LCVNGRKGIGPATATALFAFAAAREAPAWCGRGRKARVLGLIIPKQREKCWKKNEPSRTNDPRAGTRRDVSRRGRGRTRESQREGRDTDDERGVKSELRGRVEGVGGGRSESRRANFAEKRERAPGWRYFRHGGNRWRDGSVPA
jgi:hypothetical protein